MLLLLLLLVLLYKILHLHLPQPLRDSVDAHLKASAETLCLKGILRA